MQQSHVLRVAVIKLMEVLEEENAALSQQAIISHAGFTDRKNQALRELMAAQRRDAGSAGAEALRPELQHLAAILRINGRLLKDHIAAVGEVSDILVGNLRQAESDGTYSRAMDWRGRR